MRADTGLSTGGSGAGSRAFRPALPGFLVRSASQSRAALTCGRAIDIAAADTKEPVFWSRRGRRHLWGPPFARDRVALPPAQWKGIAGNRNNKTGSKNWIDCLKTVLLVWPFGWSLRVGTIFYDRDGVGMRSNKSSVCPCHALLKRIILVPM